MLDNWAIFRVDIGFYMEIVFWALLESFSTIHVLGLPTSVDSDHVVFDVCWAFGNNTSAKPS